MNSEELTDEIIRTILQALEDEVYTAVDLTNLAEELSALEAGLSEYQFYEETMYSALNKLNERLKVLEGKDGV